MGADMKFMVCDDGSKNAKKSLELAREHAKVWGIFGGNQRDRERTAAKAFLHREKRPMYGKRDQDGSGRERHCL